LVKDVGAALVAHLGAFQKIRLLQELKGKISHEEIHAQRNGEPVALPGA
jgi:hypothetical protein